MLRFRLTPEPFSVFYVGFRRVLLRLMLCDLGCKLLKINLLKCGIFSNLELDINKLRCYEERI